MDNIALTPSSLSARAHIGLYRACSNGLISLATNTFKIVTAPLQFSKKFTVVDLGWTLTLRAVNKTTSYFFNKEVFEPETLQTEAQKVQQREIIQLSRTLGPSYSKFSYETAHFVNEFIPSFIANQLSGVPATAEALALYRLGLIIRYFNHQLKRHTDYRNKFIVSEAGKTSERLWTRTRTQLAYLLTGENVLSQFVNTEHLLLHILNNLKQQMAAKSVLPWMEVFLHSLASSVSHQKKIDLFLAPFSQNSWEDQFIVRLKWHKIHNCLPEGLPDPDRERLSSQNLKSKLDEALNAYLEKNVTQLMELIFPEAFKSKLSIVGASYGLEGKKMLVDLVVYLAGEFGIKQIADPHLFALAVLKSFGKETLSYETDAFGRNKENLIFSTGIKMTQANFSQIHTLYEQSLLKQDPAGFEAISQRNAAKSALRECLVELIYATIKTNEEFKHPGGIIKALREKMGKIPVIGSATTGLHILISGSLFSLGYLFRKSDDQNMSFYTYMFKHLTGKKLAEYLADRIVELIYHPSWRITLLQLMNHLIYALKNPQETILTKDQWQSEDYHNISQFIFHHFNQGTPVPFQRNITAMVDGEAALKQFINTIASQEGIVDMGLESLIPTIKELLLFIRVTDTFRKQGAIFEGDAKFWECFVREWLNRKATSRRKDGKNQVPLTEHRKILVEELLALHGEQLRSALAKTIDEDFIQVGGIPKELIEEEYFGPRINRSDRSEHASATNHETPMLRIIQD